MELNALEKTKTKSVASRFFARTLKIDGSSKFVMWIDFSENHFDLYLHHLSSENESNTLRKILCTLSINQRIIRVWEFVDLHFPKNFLNFWFEKKSFINLTNYSSKSYAFVAFNDSEVSFLGTERMSHWFISLMCFVYTQSCIRYQISLSSILQEVFRQGQLLFWFLFFSEFMSLRHYGSISTLMTKLWN